MRCFRFILPLLFWAVTVPPARAQDAGERPTVAHPASLINNGDFTQEIREGDFSPGSWATIRTAVMEAPLEPPVAGYKRLARLDCSPLPGEVPWNTCFVQRCTGAVRSGDAVRFRAWLRSADRCAVCFVYEARSDAHKYIEQIVGLTPEWKEYCFVGRGDRDMGAGESQVNFFLGYQRGVVEMAGVRVENCGPAAGHTFDQTAVQPPRPEDLIVREVPPQRPALDPPVSLIKNGDFAQALEGNWDAGDAALPKVTPIAVEAGAYTRGLRLECSSPPGGDPSKIGLRQVCAAEVQRGDAVCFRARLRSPDGCSVCFVWKMNPWPRRALIEQLVWLGPQWQEYRFMARADRDLPAGQTTGSLFAGYKKGVVEVAGVRLENFGGAPTNTFDQTPDLYGGRAHPDTWRAAAQQRIERIRQGDLKVQVLDADGRPVSGAQVRVGQLRHGFRFGSEAAAARLLDTKDADNLRYQQEVLRLYNTVTFGNDLKWEQMRTETRRAADEASVWLKAHDIALRGHNLLWGSYMFTPAPFNKLRGAELLKACHEHVTEYAAWMKGKVYIWDVVNEAVTNTEVWDEIGWDKFADAYRWTRAADPNVLLCYNEYNIVQENAQHRAKAAQRVRYLLEHQAPLDVLGIQGHMSVPLTPIDRVLEILDEWAQFGKDLEITEFELCCKDDKAHGVYVRDFMTAVFSHPKVRAFIIWGLWEGYHWRAQQGAAMFRKDWSKRPGQEAWEDLVLRQWWTRWQGATGADGLATLRAFYGKHSVTAEAGGKRAAATIELAPGKEGVVVLQLK